MTTITLEYPVTHKGETISTLTLRRLKARDLMAMDAVQGDVAKSLAMYASLTGTPLPVIEDLDAEDFARLSEAALPFLGKAAAATAEDQAVAAASA